MSDPATPPTIDPGNAPMQEYWAGSRGQSWVRRSVAYDGQLRAYTEALVAELAPAPGESALDVGCGTGFTTRALAAGVGADGSAVGVDLSAAMIAGARAAADASGVERNGQPTFHLADAQVADLAALNDGRPYDVIASRFGVMFFSDPDAAFANLAAAAAPGARLALVCWASPALNPWFTEPRNATIPLLESVTGASAPEPADAPGPFSMADPDRPITVLERAGWVDASVRPVNTDLYLGGPGPIGSAVEFLTSGSAMAPVITAHPELLQPVRDALIEALSPHHDGTGVCYAAAAHLITATLP